MHQVSIDLCTKASLNQVKPSRKHPVNFKWRRKRHKGLSRKNTQRERERETERDTETETETETERPRLRPSNT